MWCVCEAHIVRCCRRAPCITTPATHTPCPTMPTTRTSWSSSIRRVIVACTHTDNVCKFCRRTQQCTAPSMPPTAHRLRGDCRITVIQSAFSWQYLADDKMRIVTSSENCIVTVCSMHLFISAHVVHKLFNSFHLNRNGGRQSGRPVLVRYFVRHGPTDVHDVDRCVRA